MSFAINKILLTGFEKEVPCITFSGQARIVMKNGNTVLCDINHQDPEAKGLDQEEFDLFSFLSPTTAVPKEMKEYW